jgi:hypothetical protein
MVYPVSYNFSIKAHNGSFKPLLTLKTILASNISMIEDELSKTFPVEDFFVQVPQDGQEYVLILDPQVDNLKLTFDNILQKKTTGSMLTSLQKWWNDLSMQIKILLVFLIVAIIVFLIYKLLSRKKSSNQMSSSENFMMV